ncbi:hypothetical protein ACPV5T_15415, partial [Vibrio astriarenae]
MPIKTKITASALKNLKVEDKRLNDTEVVGFHVRISQKGIMKYYLFYRLNGKQVVRPQNSIHSQASENTVFRSHLVTVH